MELQTKTWEGSYRLLYGANLYENGVEFSFASRSATGARVLLYDSVEAEEPQRTITLDPDRDRFGDVWRVFVPKPFADEGTLYHFQVDGPYAPERGLRFNGKARLIDPYARALTGNFQSKVGGACRPPKCVVVADYFDWEGDRPIDRAFGDETIYELHTRGFTVSPTSGVSKPGTYLGLVEKIPYLKSLGITAVELMPIHEFAMNEPTGEPSRRKNYWGYDPIAFFAPHRGYAWDKTPGAQVREFKETVKAFHRAGLEVYLDVVFNHTAEGGEQGEIFTFKGLQNDAYYMLDKGGEFLNYTGCGNTVNGNHPWTRQLIYDCLRYWVCNFHIDGFRFDLASVLSRDRKGALVINPPTIETIAEDPVLAGSKIIAEAWDAAGAYQVGSFGGARWAEWNGRFRDDVRCFLKGDSKIRGSFATRIGGSSDLYKGRGRNPTCSVNFVTAHDGFTLNDLTSYNEKHNFANGEENRDGSNCNFSYNFGWEGETTDPRIEELRERQIRNFFCAEFLSQGVPMIVAGDEVRRTQKGNNNAYCQDSEISWFDWDRAERYAGLRRFVSELIRFRRREASLRRRDFFTGAPREPNGIPDVSWFEPNGRVVEDWNGGSKALVFLISAINPRKEPGFEKEFAHAASRLSGALPFFNATDELAPESKRHILAVFNPTHLPIALRFPSRARVTSREWRLFVDTAARSPNDIYPNCDGPLADLEGETEILERSARVYVALNEA